MKNLIIILCSLFICGCATLEKLKQSSQKIEVDGSNHDWPEIHHYIKDIGILYEVFYDTNYLYVLVKTHDENAKRSIISSGLTVWIDANGKKKKNFGITYPIIKNQHSKNRPENRPQSINKDVFL